MILRRLAALPGVSQVEKDKRRHEAIGILNGLMADQQDPHPFHVKAELLLDELEERLDDPNALADEVTRKQIAELVRDAERTLQQGTQLFPGGSYLATAASRLASILENHPKALSILEAAFKQNQQNAFVAIRLARQHQAQNNIDAAIEVLRRALALNPSNKDVHYALAQAMRVEDEHKSQREIGQHLMKSFSDGDNRYDARLYFGRHQYLYGDRHRARQEFDQLSRVPLPPKELSRVRAVIRDRNREPIVYSGELTAKRDSYCFVRCHALGDDIFVHATEFDRSDWESAGVGSTVKFRVGFSMKGVHGTRVVV